MQPDVENPGQRSPDLGRITMRREDQRWTMDQAWEDRFDFDHLRTDDPIPPALPPLPVEAAWHVDHSLTDDAIDAFGEGAALSGFTSHGDPGHGGARASTDQGIATSPTVLTYAAGDGFSNINGDLVTHAVFSPPDNALAVSVVGTQKYYVSMVNDTMGMGTSLSPNTMQFQAFSQFFPANLVNGLYFTDPQVVYDAAHGKFVAVEETYKSSSTVSNMLYAVSHDANPFDGWDFFSLNMQVSIAGKKTGMDYPQLDTDGLNYFVTTDQYSGNTEIAPLVTVGSLASIESGATGASPPVRQFVPQTPMTMPLDVAALPGKGAFLVGYSGYSQGTHQYVTIDYYADATNTTTSGVYDVGAIDTTSVKTLVASEPNGHVLDASDRRVNDAKVIGSDLYVVTETVPKTAGAQPTVTVFDFSLLNGQGAVDPTKPHLVNTWTVPGSVLGQGVTTMYGSISGDVLPNGSRELVLNFVASGPSLTPSDYVLVHKATDTTPGAFWEAPLQYGTSPTSYSDGSKISRWGDYSSATLAATHDVVVSNEYAVDSGHWGTKIADIWLA